MTYGETGAAGVQTYHGPSPALRRRASGIQGFPT